MPISRRKSCQHCSRAKARCNLAAKCSRCVDRGLDCTYPPFSSISHSKTVVIESGQLPGLDSMTLGLGNTGMTGFQLTGNESEAMTDDDIGGPSPDWSGSSLFPLSACDTSASLNSATDMIDEAQNAVLRSNHVFPDAMGFSNLSSASEDKGVIVLYGAVYHNLLFLKPQPSLTGRLIWGQLKSYPCLLMHGQLPPFIYPPCVLNDQLPKNCVARGVHQCLHEPLAICVSHIGMFEARTPTNSSSVWKTIYSEIHRLKCSFQTYSPDNLLATFQALTIYLLLQAQDPTSRTQNDVGSLVVAIVEVASYLGQIQGHTHCLEPFNQSSLTQSEWVFNESIRRTAHVFYLLESILLEVIIGSDDPKGCGGFDPVLLSGPRVLWDYHSNEAWAWRLDRLKSQGSAPQLTIRHLRAAGRGEAVEGMDAWCESADEFGGLLLMSSLLD